MGAVAIRVKMTDSDQDKFQIEELSSGCMHGGREAPLDRNVVFICPDLRSSELPFVVLLPSNDSQRPRLPLSNPEPPAQYSKHQHTKKKENFTDKYDMIPLYTHNTCALYLFKKTRLGYADKPVATALARYATHAKHDDDAIT